MTSHQRSSELALEEPNPISFCYLQKITRKAISSVTEHNETLDRETTLIIVLYRERYPPPPKFSILHQIELITRLLTRLLIIINDVIIIAVQQVE